MAGLQHKFIALSKSELDKLTTSNQIYDIDERIGTNRICIHDSYIQLLIQKRYLVTIPSYDYKNQNLTNGLFTLGVTIFHPEQIQLFYDRVSLFEQEISIQSNIERIASFGLERGIVLIQLENLKDFLRCTMNEQLYVLHLGV